MYTEADFKRIEYNRPYPLIGARYIKDVIGLDTETTNDGNCFLIATSTGDYFLLESIPQIFFSRKYRNKHFVVWNLKFDSGSLVQRLPSTKRVELWDKQKCKYGDYTWKYIPNKMLRISKGRNAITIWDIQSFYGSSLEYASNKYLGKHKLELETKEFTDSYIATNIDKIVEYCVNDAILTRELALLFLKKIRKFRVRPNSLYSIATVGLNYLRKKIRLEDINFFWRFYPELVKFAWLSYSGGKFEILARGHFEGYEYDIISAYAYEISKLVGLKYSKVICSNRYREDADYGFLKVLVDIQTPIFHPISYKVKKLSIYPIGSYPAFITKDEYDYLLTQGIRLKIEKGYWIIAFKKYYPFKDVINYLVILKEVYKNKDIIVSNIAKAIANSFYGKMSQLIETPENKLKAGIAWNPILASTITARVRIRMSNLQQELRNNCLAVHTDSIVTLKPLDNRYLSNRIGGFKLVEQGEGLIILSGVYQIGNKCAVRGYLMDKGFNWINLLKAYPNRDSIRIKSRLLESWLNTCFRGNYSDMNRFVECMKTIKLNNERKRVWLSRTNARKLLSGLEYSIPHIIL